MGLNPYKSSGGYTLIEMLTVVTIISILANLAIPSYRHTVIKANETALKRDLFTIRDVIDQYRADTGAYPASLGVLRTAGYLRTIPADPFTKSDTSWQTLLDPDEGGIADVHSGSTLVALDGTPYNAW